MRKQGQLCFTLFVILCSLALPGCFSELWTGANLVYDRHNTYIKLNDFQMNAQANRLLYHDKTFKCDGCAIEIAVFNRDILLVGRVPSDALRKEAYERIKTIPNKRRFFKQLTVRTTPPADPIKDSWITTKIRGLIFADADINPGQFKIVTSEQIVYVMGDVVPKQAETVIGFARSCEGVTRVVTLLQYYNLSDKPRVPFQYGHDPKI